MNIKSRKILAREFIYLLLGVLLCCLIFLGYDYLHENNIKSCVELENEIEKITADLPARQLLWLELSEKKYLEDSYGQFQLKYNNAESQEFLFNLLKNNELFTGSFDEFRLKYFRKNKANDDVYQIYIKEKSWVNKDEFNLLLKNPSTVDWLYTKSVAEGYKHSLNDFKNLIFGSEEKHLSIHQLRIKYQSIKELKQKLEKKKLSFFNTYQADLFLEISLTTFSILFVFRYLKYGIKWSLKQIKDK
ncbi:MAG: hypothetical protein ACU4F9_07175 [Arcticibacter sp.]